MPLTRFAPSPTGHLHLGHAYAALIAAEEAKGDMLLRIEDIDPGRCRQEFTESIVEDLDWLGLTWPKPVRHQSHHMNDYRAAFDILHAQGLVYPCFCTRREIEREVHGASQAPHMDDKISIYPGTCRHLSEQSRAERWKHFGKANWRLDVTAALKLTGELFWHDRLKGKIAAQPELFGDVILARKDVPTSYHLSVTVDDHLQGITLVTRGVDLFASTHIHRLLQALLGYDVPAYYHHRLLLDDEGRRYAKRDKAVTLRALRLSGETIVTLRKKIPTFT